MTLDTIPRSTTPAEPCSQGKGAGVVSAYRVAYSPVFGVVGNMSQSRASRLGPEQAPPAREWATCWEYSAVGVEL